MSLHNLAYDLQTKGRGEDSMLVHMTPKEVGGLEALARAHGGMLTTNPHTGLPEAGFLSSILPTLAGAALTIGSGGAINPVTAGMIVGGFEGLRTGDLGKGLMAGLGAWGGGGLGQGLAGLGAASAEGLAGQLGVEGAKTGAGSQAAMLAEQTAGMDAAFQTANQEAIRNAASQAAGSEFAPAMSSWDKVTAGAKSLTEPGGLSGLAGQMGGTSDLIKSGAAAAAPMMMGAMQPKQLQATPVDKGNIRPFEFSRTQNAQAYQRAPGDTSEQNYFTNMYTPKPIYAAASGGEVPRYMDGGLLPPPSEPAYDTSLRYANGGTVDDEPGTDDVPSYFGEGGIAAFRKGTFLQGNGDGMSDSIPATINGNQPARLADGEFIVPADVVSHIGNGSSKAGAQKLYGMMDKVRKARTGKKSQAPAINPKKYMPA